MKRAIIFFAILLLFLQVNALDIEITGEGDWPIPLHGAVKKDMDSNSGNRWIDRSGSADKARQQEVDIGRSDFGSDEAGAEEIAGNLKNGSQANVTIRYKTDENGTTITVFGPNGYTERRYNSSENASEQADQILDDIATVSEGCRTAEDCEDNDECTEDHCVDGSCIYEIIPCPNLIKTLRGFIGREVPLISNEQIKIITIDGRLLATAIVKDSVLVDVNELPEGESFRVILNDEDVADRILDSENKIKALLDSKEAGEFVVEAVGFSNQIQLFFLNIIAPMAAAFG